MDEDETRVQGYRLMSTLIAHTMEFFSAKPSFAFLFCFCWEFIKVFHLLLTSHPFALVAVFYPIIICHFPITNAIALMYAYDINHN